MTAPCDSASKNNQQRVAYLLHVDAFQQVRYECIGLEPPEVPRTCTTQRDLHT
jgi:hypothetical protein